MHAIFILLERNEGKMIIACSIFLALAKIRRQWLYDMLYLCHAIFILLERNEGKMIIACSL
jgi:multisubunit Na+/H+ antiporter MnhC subunit